MCHRIFELKVSNNIITITNCIYIFLCSIYLQKTGDCSVQVGSELLCQAKGVLWVLFKGEGKIKHETDRLIGGGCHQ